MLQNHEIPKGARLYFGKTAKLKRDIEQIASEIFYSKGFEEIATPLFSYHQHRLMEDDSQIIRLSDEKNRTLSLRADSTIDVVRLITNRLGRSTEHKKWFYIQPIYRYPTHEFYQIGAEILESADISLMLSIALQFFKKVQLQPWLQLSNIKIPELLIKEYGINAEDLKNGNIHNLLHTEHRWMENLLYLHETEQIEDVLEVVPEDIEAELLKIKEAAESVAYEKLIVAPLFYTDMRYYKDVIFRFFEGNLTLAMGGEYRAAGLEANGFSIYTDYVINLVKGE